MSLYDSSEIKVIRPSQAKEKLVFADEKLKYDHKAVAKEGWLEKFQEWLADKLFGGRNYQNISMARTIIIWTIVLVAIAIAIWLLSKTQMVSLIKPKAKATSFNFTDITEDLNTINFNLKIAEALKNSDYRLAIRWHYLKTLFVLDKKQVIAFAPFKTNIDYGNELKGKDYHQGFMKLSRIYEYVWYGQFILNEAGYKSNALEFETIEKQIGV